MSLVAIYNYSLSANLNRSARVMVWMIASLPLWGHSQALEPNGLQMGSSVFGNVFASHELASVAVRENEWLNRARITGEGFVFMKSRSPQRLCIVGKSLINHLFIDNPTCIALQGNLYIVKSLRVITGVFDVTENNLTRDFYGQTHLFAGALSQDEPVVKGNWSGVKIMSKQSLPAVLECEWSFLKASHYLIKQSITDKTLEASYAWQPLIINPPPESLQCSRVEQ